MPAPCVVKPMFLLAACLASLSGRWACHGTNATTSADRNPSEQTGLEPALGAAGLENPGAAHHALLELGLTSLRDIRLLDTAEGVELKAALALADIVLGDRSKIRIVAATGELGSGPTHQSQDLSRFLRHWSQILRETHSSEVAGTPYAHKRVSRRSFVVVERPCTTWTCLRVFLHSRACTW